ncbi:hypothetical protein ACFTXM_26130 [Streptomyces sp. NPDC056930]|uniref:hypothetical protein n=1 Tax=Streptomyces sp. NPDC056930 TaxID=3345967 RepID=UPI00363FE843
MFDTEGVGGRAVSHEMEDADDTDRGGSGMGRRLSCLAVVVAVFALGAGSLVWLFQDELFHPFGDARACEGSDTMLPKVISAGGVPIPADASDIHYATENGSARVSFLSNQMPDYLHSAGLVPEAESLFDKNYGGGFVHLYWSIKPGTTRSSASQTASRSARPPNATSAYCLHLYHLSRGELRDADHWALEAATFEGPPAGPIR